MRLPVAAALALSLFSMDMGAQTRTYEQSIGEKWNVPCVRQAGANPARYREFLNIVRKVENEVHDAVYSSGLSYNDIHERILGLPQKYGACAAMLGLKNPVRDDFYKKMGMEKPPLTGTYEEQASAVAREAVRQIGGYAAYEAIVRQAAAKRTYPVQKAKDVICGLPDSISADIEIDSMPTRGRLWPRFNVNYGERSVIFLNHTNELPVGGVEYSIGNSRYMLVQRQGQPSSLITRYPDGAMSTMSSETFQALVNYADLRDNKGGWLGRPGSICYDGSDRFGEFLRHMDSLGSFDSMRFRSDSELGRWFVGRPIFFVRHGFRASAPGRQMSVGAYHVSERSADPIDGDYYRLFLEDFDSWLSFGGARKAVRISQPITRRNPGPPLPGVADAQKRDMANQILIITEER